jgi:capsular polysaccharide transport system permease protein
LFLGVVVIPMVVAAIYYAWFAIDRYASQSDIVVRQPGNSGGGGAVAGLAMLVGASNPTSREETLFLQTFITSADMLNVLESKLDWSSHYKANHQDLLFWLSAQSSREDILKFYQRMVTVTFDDTTGLLNVKVQAFEPVFAKRSLELIISTAQAFVNELSRQMAREQLAFTEGELALARQSYEDKRAILVAFQNTSSVLDLEATAVARASLIHQIEAQLVNARAELTALLATLAPNAPQVLQKQNLIASLHAELQSERIQLTSDQANTGLNVLASKYRELTINAGIAEEAYKLAVAAVENARIESSKQLRALLVIVSPNLPDEPTYPEKLYNLTALLLGLLMLYGILRFLVATIEDHRD